MVNLYTKPAILLFITQVFAVRTPSKSSLDVGMLFLAKEGTEYLDTGGIDLLAMLTPEYQTLIGSSKQLQDQAVKMNVHYISETGTLPMPLTGNAKLVMTVSSSKQNRQQEIRN